MLKTMKLRSKVTIVCCLLLALAVPSVGQTRKPNRSDSAALRSRFVEAFGKDFELVKDEIKTRANESSGETFWLAQRINVFERIVTDGDDVDLAGRE